MEWNRDTELELDRIGPYLNECFEGNYRSPKETDFILPKSLADQIEDPVLLHKHLPKQTDIDRLLEQINRKVLRNIHLPGSIRHLEAAYLDSPHFIDIYIYLQHNRVPSNKRLARRMKFRLIIIFNLINYFFKLMPNLMGIYTPLLCIPSSKVEPLLHQYHTSLIGGYNGITKIYRTISDRYYCPNLAFHLRAYMTGCHLCQLFKNAKRFSRPFQKRTNFNTSSLTKISMDFKHMPKSTSNYKFILVLMYEVSNFMFVRIYKN